MLRILVNRFKYPLHEEEFTAVNQLQPENMKVDGSVAAYEFLLHGALQMMVIDFQSNCSRASLSWIPSWVALLPY